MSKAGRRSAREVQIEGEIADLDRIAKLAESMGKTADAVKAIERCGMLRAEAIRLRALRIAEAENDPVARLRALGEVAAQCDSWTAANKYHRDAAEAELRRAALQKQAEVDGLEGAGDATLVAVIAQALPEMPRAVVAQIMLDGARALSLDLGRLTKVLESETGR